MYIKWSRVSKFWVQNLILKYRKVLSEKKRPAAGFGGEGEASG